MPRSVRQKPQTKTLRKRESKVDVGKCFVLSMRGVADVDIAQMAGVSPQIIGRLLKPLRDAASPEAAEAYRSGERDVLTNLNAGIVGVMADPDRIAAADFRELAYAFDKIFGARRLIDDKSTSNVGLRSVMVSDAHTRPIYELGEAKTPPEPAPRASQEPIQDRVAALTQPTQEATPPKAGDASLSVGTPARPAGGISLGDLDDVS